MISMALIREFVQTVLCKLGKHGFSVENLTSQIRKRLQNMGIVFFFKRLKLGRILGSK